MPHQLFARLILAGTLGLAAATASADPAATGDHPPPAGTPFADQPPGHPGPSFGPPSGPESGPGPGFGHDRGAEPGPGFGTGFGHGPGGPGGGPAGEVLQTLHQIEHLYREQGKTREVIALYQEVLGKTKDPLVRHFAYDAIARVQAQPVETDKAIATLRQSLDESLQHLNQMPPPGARHDHDGQGTPGA